MHFQLDRTIGRGVLQLRLPEWRLKAACRDVDPAIAKIVFFPESGAKSEAHRQWCDVCPVKTDCLEDGLAQEGKGRVGIYGGLTQRELARERAKRKGHNEPVFHGNVKKPIEHGTLLGFEQHRARHMKACAACRAAVRSAREEQLAV